MDGKRRGPVHMASCCMSRLRILGKAWAPNRWMMLGIQTGALLLLSNRQKTPCFPVQRATGQPAGPFVNPSQTDHAVHRPRFAPITYSARISESQRCGRLIVRVPWDHRDEADSLTRTESAIRHWERKQSVVIPVGKQFGGTQQPRKAAVQSGNKDVK
jgi:hypothetical protein